MVLQEYLLFKDLPALNSNPDQIRSRFENIFHAKPDGIALNHETYYNAVKPPITEQYGRYCYKKVGEMTLIPRPGSSSEKVMIVGTDYIENNSKFTTTQASTVKGTWAESVSHTTSSTVGLTFGQKITFEGIFEMGMEFSASVTTEETVTERQEQEKSSTVTVTLPPYSAAKVSMQATMREETMDFTAPITISGYFGANFPSKVDGHYFWFESANNLLPMTSGTLTGRITGVKAFDVHTVVEDVSLDELVTKRAKKMPVT